jgi:hypothetical protein
MSLPRQTEKVSSVRGMTVSTHVRPAACRAAHRSVANAVNARCTPAAYAGSVVSARLS